MIEAGGRTICCEIHKLIIFTGNRKELPEEWKESTIVPIYKKALRDCSNYRGISVLQTTYENLSHILLSMLTPYAEEIIGIINVDFDAIGQLLIIYSAFVKYLRKTKNTMKQSVNAS
jgi:hypothetical protein